MLAVQVLVPESEYPEPTSKSDAMVQVDVCHLGVSKERWEVEIEPLGAYGLVSLAYAAENIQKIPCLKHGRRLVFSDCYMGTMVCMHAYAHRNISTHTVWKHILLCMFAVVSA